MLVCSREAQHARIIGACSGRGLCWRFSCKLICSALKMIMSCSPSESDDMRHVDQEGDPLGDQGVCQWVTMQAISHHIGNLVSSNADADD